MKKLNLKLDGIRERLTKEQMKRVTGGSSGSAGGGCVGGNQCHLSGESGYNCNAVYYMSYYGGTGTSGPGNCNTQGAAGHPSVCDNYCGEPVSGSTFWCNC